MAKVSLVRLPPSKSRLPQANSRAGTTSPGPFPFGIPNLLAGGSVNCRCDLMMTCLHHAGIDIMHFIAGGRVPRRQEWMTITPLVAAAVPAGIAAVQLAHHTIENRPFRNLLAQIGVSQNAPPQPLQDSAETELTDFLQLVQSTLATSGIDTKLSFDISSDASGQLHISGNHPRQAEIQQILNESDAVVTAFHQLAANTQLRNAAEAHLEFAEQYVRDPESAVLQAPRSATAFSLTINGDKIAMK